MVTQIVDRSDQEAEVDLTKLTVQRDFVYCTEKFPAYCGGFAPGKTTGLCVRGLYLTFEIPGNLGFIGRMDGKDQIGRASCRERV